MSNINLLVLENLNNLGKHKDVPIEKFCSKQIKLGLDVEKEHTNDPNIALRIVKDHLFEIPDYYTRLKNMEKSIGEKHV
jgi:hypothetical protein